MSIGVGDMAWARTGNMPRMSAPAPADADGEPGKVKCVTISSALMVLAGCRWPRWSMANPNLGVITCGEATVVHMG
ncbi:hypothetical protein Rhe02_37910 [Rhizocola hellebori]|uniref:Uncharacterized protein n=2 Tax=Rhizocola hellebori TaxID=1392758 RepID=A0A8J3VFV9_9ACTN|nr:hypothetical protein Rhe02_37910 [Rhizocola hellebori]